MKEENFDNIFDEEEQPEQEASTKKTTAFKAEEEIHGAIYDDTGIFSLSNQILDHNYT